MHTVLFLCVRVLHILIGAVWIGWTVFSALMVTPAIEASGTSGGHAAHELRSGQLDPLRSEKAISDLGEHAQFRWAAFHSKTLHLTLVTPTGSTLA